MSEKSSFFDSIGDDRLYNSADFANYFNSLITNGVFPNPSTNLQVLTNNDMTVTVKAGKAWINGYVYINDSDLILPIEVADGVLNRIDRIVVQFNTVGRAINAVVKKGTFASSPVAPALVRDADFYELGIADIYIVNGATSIVQGDITDLRMNTTYCGWVNSLIQADTTAIFDQYQAWFTTQSDTYDADMLATQTQFETDFNTWFATIQNALDGDTAGNLLNLINANSAEIGDLSLIAETDLISAIQADRSSLTEMTILNPIETDDISKEYFIGKHIINTATGEEWICTDNTLNNAIWKRFGYDKVSAVIYGVKIDTTNSNPLSALTYTDNAIGLTPALGNNGTFNAGSWADKFPFNAIKPCLYKDGVVNYYLNPNNYAQKVDGVTASDITSGADGDVMIEFPKIWWKFETIGSDLYVKYSNVQTEGTYKCLAHMRGVTEKDFCYISAYMGYDLTSELRSLSGKTPTATQTIGAFRTLAQANGGGYDQMAYYPLLMLQVLFTVMFKNRDSQTALGRGYVDGNASAIATGGANAKGMFYGETTGKLQNKFCGIEDFYGNVRYWIDGFFSDANRSILIANQTFNDTGSGYADYGVGAVANISGYIDTIQGGTETGFVVKTVAGSATTHYADYGYLSASCLPYFGGNWTTADNAGAFNLFAGNDAASSAAYRGARLLAL